VRATPFAGGSDARGQSDGSHRVARARCELAIVDQSEAAPASAGHAVDFFGRAAKIDLGGPSGDIAAWIPTAIQVGGQQAFGSVLVTLDPLRPVSHLVLFVQD